ncbi:YggS family pyridoxal phosphate-dependent enzyme [Shewanella sp. 1_MG-2023]|uniref:YggS family pyridoxal phosphate-dependent enzyme n=1 Tax=unclassified Shewanella TaxID=196818 RepID=UPI0026E28E64|nr:MULTISPECIES: YggS family pyridoxal phosphate-dependent enzyme [unclassified Shewanella]MDO6610096.1 YggS family pyridoxal phosphate-dependent enzyme [Shewanella sp. 7_MG-2023]MDO6769762.1 YggS family pyridoxal phosphate-dependent enzyme [Shewanella sp. 2_MG-2023]MDO6792826.1 YggS family pyridoxal phosphate-dependent enzyme [Shewanella sp. 1_MG-2023]
MTTIADRISIAQSQIAQAAQNCSRNSEEVTLLAVSKTKPIEDIIAAYEAGQRCFGENYVQEGEEKVIALSQSHPDIEWHFIGPLQSNKSRIIAEHFDWMHTLSREKIATRLNEQRPDDKLPLQVCIQVNVSNEASKSGVSSEEVNHLAQIIDKLPHLTLRGLMAIPTATEDVNLQRQEFAQLENLYLELKQQYLSVDTLSMGMSSDLAIAIEHGSTMVRIGTGIFGSRA